MSRVTLPLLFVYLPLEVIISSGCIHWDSRAWRSQPYFIRLCPLHIIAHRRKARHLVSRRSVCLRMESTFTPTSYTTLTILCHLPLLLASHQVRLPLSFYSYITFLLDIMVYLKNTQLLHNSIIREGKKSSLNNLPGALNFLHSSMI